MVFTSDITSGVTVCITSDFPSYSSIYLPMNVIHDFILGFVVLHFCQKLHSFIDTFSGSMWLLGIKRNGVMGEGTFFFS